MRSRHKNLDGVGTAHSSMPRFYMIALTTALALGAVSAPAATQAPINGEIERITINDPSDHWSGGTIVVGGQNVIIPRNLLMDLPANRLTLQQLFAEASAACIAANETGLVKADSCNTSGTGGFATISANRTSAGNIIAGDVFIQKGTESVAGDVTYINYDDGYFRINGSPGSATTGVMIRLNDPESRHTIQKGAGCAAGSLNCSPDPRFTLDPDNYTNVFSTGYPFCIPSTQSRTFTDTLGLGVTTAQSGPDGRGDVLCPDANRSAQPVSDSRRFAPIQVGDNVLAEGNFETVGGVRFLSAHTTTIHRALITRPDSDQPDYLFLDEVEIDTGGFQNQRARTLLIGFTTLAPTDVMFWSLHYDPATNSPHEFPLASVAGCDAAAGPATCGAQGLVGAGANIFKIRHDVDFLVGAKPRLNPCAHLLADPRFAATNPCPNGGAAEGNIVEMFGILTPIPHELQARTGHKYADLQLPTPLLRTVDIHGNEATNGQYLFPLGMNLGGISVPEFVEIDLDAVSTPFLFTSIPWNLDRRLGPGGCNGPCESTPQPLDPFPFEGLDPRTQAPGIPTGPYNDPNFTASLLSNVTNRILSFVDPALGKFNGDATVLAWPPQNPALLPITPTDNVLLSCTASSVGGGAGGSIGNLAPSFTSTPVTTAVVGRPYGYRLAATDPNGDTPLSFSLVSGPAGMRLDTVNNVITWRPLSSQIGTHPVTLQVRDPGGMTGTQSFSVTVTATPPNQAPVISSTAPLLAVAGRPYQYRVVATDPEGGALTYSLDTAPAGMSISATGVISWTPTAAQGGNNAVTVRVQDAQLASATQSFTISVDALTIARAEFRTGTLEWRVDGTGSIIGTTVTIHLNGANGTVLATTSVDPLGAWTFRQQGSAVSPAGVTSITAVSAGGSVVSLPLTVRN